MISHQSQNDKEKETFNLCNRKVSPSCMCAPSRTRLEEESTKAQKVSAEGACDKQEYSLSLTILDIVSYKQSTLNLLV